MSIEIININKVVYIHKQASVLVDELRADSKRFGHVSQRQRAVGLQELAVGQDAHLSNIVTVMRSKQPVLLHLLFHSSYRRETDGASDQNILNNNRRADLEKHFQ